MLVVSDASPIIILIRIGQVELLAKLFLRVVIPKSVAEEMSHGQTPQVVREWVAHPPTWLGVQTPSATVTSSILRHRGERDAIELACELSADAILIDEERARAQASAMGLRVVGKIGILEQAANRGLLADLKAAHGAIRLTDFRVSDELLSASMTRHLRAMGRATGGKSTA